MARGAFAILVASEATRRRGTYALIALVFLTATAGLSVLLGAVDGFESAVGGQLRTTLSADHRVGVATTERLGEAAFFEDAHQRAGELSAQTGARAAPRIEFKGLFLASPAYEDFQAGLIVGIEPARDPHVAPLSDVLVDGRVLDAENVWIDGAPYPQLLVGAGLAERLDLSVYEGGALAREHVLNVTAGRFSGDDGSIRPVVKQGVVVGTFRTGFTPIDDGTVFLHLETARSLLRMEFGDAANLLLARGGEGVPEAARALGMSVTASDDFRASYLAAVFAPLAFFTRIVLGVVLVLAGGWVAHVVAHAVQSDRRRLSVLRALGTPTRLLLGPLALLVLAAALVGGAAGLAAGRGIAWTLGAMGVRAPGYTHLDLVASLAWTEGAALLALVLATAAVSAAGAALALRRVPVTDALRA